MPPVRILLVHNFYQLTGGEDAVVKQEERLLLGNGNEVSLFEVHNDAIDSVWKKLRTSILVVYNPFARTALAKRIREFRPDVVHIHNLFPLLSPSVLDACRAAGVPTVMTLHNFRILCPTAFLYAQDKIREESIHGSSWWTVRERVYRGSLLGSLAVACMVEFHKRRGTWRDKVDRFIALTEFSKRKFVEGGLPASRIVVKPHSASASYGRAHGDGSKHQRHGALFVGRLSTEKGIENLLRAWEQIDYPLRIAGDGPMRSLIERTKNPNIQFLGQLPSLRVREEMERAAFLVLPSVWYEMFGMIIIEAFASGLPVVASNLASTLR